MDLLTSARTWTAGARRIESDHEVDPARWMPLLPRAVMFVSVVGPLAALGVAIGLLWHDRSAWGIGWPEVALMVVMYGLSGFGVTIGFHRLLTHRSFQTSRFMRLLLAILGSCAAQGRVICWCATHRRHHQRSDREGDPHSPHRYGEGIVGVLRGFCHAHVGWVFEADKPGLERSVSDLIADPILVRIDQLYFFWIFVGLLVPAAALGLWTHSWHGWIAGLIWGGLVRICLTQHATWSVNSVCHLWGGRPFKTSDHSKNNLPVAIFSLGEGWHNNHHAFPTSARHGFTWWQFDSSYLIIKLLAWLGIIWEVRLPSPTRDAIEAA